MMHRYIVHVKNTRFTRDLRCVEYETCSLVAERVRRDRPRVGDAYDMRREVWQRAKGAEGSKANLQGARCLGRRYRVIEIAGDNVRWRPSDKEYHVWDPIAQCSVRLREA